MQEQEKRSLRNLEQRKRDEILTIYDRSSLDQTVVQKGFSILKEFSSHYFDGAKILDPQAMDGTMAFILDVDNLFVMDENKRNRHQLHRGRLQVVKEIPEAVAFIVSLGRFTDESIQENLKICKKIFCLDLGGNIVIKSSSEE